MTPKPFSDEEIVAAELLLSDAAKAPDQFKAHAFYASVAAMLRQLLSRCQTAEAQLREADAVIKYFWCDFQTLPTPEAWDQHKEEAIARHRARSP